MSFWQENYQFIKEVYEMRHSKMAEWMENVEKAIARIMADKVYTSSEFKRERDTFNVNILNTHNKITYSLPFSLFAKILRELKLRNGSHRFWRS